MVFAGFGNEKVYIRVFIHCKWLQKDKVQSKAVCIGVAYIFIQSFWKYVYMGKTIFYYRVVIIMKLIYHFNRIKKFQYMKLIETVTLV